MYENPTPVAVSAVLLRDDVGRKTILGIVRATNPGRGGLALPGGYVDKGESAEQAAARELREETGLVTLPGDWQVRHTRVTPQNRLLIFCELTYALPEAVVQALCPNDEVLGYKALTASDVLVFPTHHEFVALRLGSLMG